MSKRILVTGGAGFIGSHYLLLLRQRYPDWELVNADALTYSANLYNLRELEGDPRYHFRQVDLANFAQVESLFQEFSFDEIVHFAAESHVDRSIESAELFLKTNVLGSYHLLEASGRYGVHKLVHISTDEVYGSFPVGRAAETTLLSPGNPYSASKASSDLFALAYANTFDLPVVVTRCTNNYGPHQHPEKLIPQLIWRCLQKEKLPIYGDGKQERDWLYVQDHCEAIDLIREKGRLGEVYHIGAEETVPNMVVAEMVLQYFGLPKSYVEHVTDRPGHDIRYSLDTTKIQEELGWKPSVPFSVGLKRTIDWYVKQTEWWTTTKQGGH